MKHATVAIPDELDEALAAYGRDRQVSGDVAAVVQAALREVLTGHGYLIPFRAFRVTPIESDDDATDVSLNHDRYLADGQTGSPG